MTDATYLTRRSELELYFDRTAVEAWRRLTSDEPVGRIRKTVRAGRDAMRATLLSWLPPDMRGLRLLDAGCGSGALAVEAARRGADVVAIDLSPTLIALARQRAPRELGAGRVVFDVGDMLDSTLGAFDHVVAMDSLIHYDGFDIARALGALASRTRGSIVFTVAPRTPALTLMHAVGRLFPRDGRAPAIVPISTDRLALAMRARSELNGWRWTRSRRVNSGFYLSQALELVPK